MKFYLSNASNYSSKRKLIEIETIDELKKLWESSGKDDLIISFSDVTSIMPSIKVYDTYIE